MIITGTDLEGVFIVDIQQHGDERGFFARTFCELEFADAGIENRWVQANTSFSALKGTLRGFHYQIPPFSETKLVRCTRGAIVDFAIDMRRDSPSYLKHVQVELTEANRRSLVIPNYCAHGFLSLEDNTEIHYSVSAPYSPEHERGIRFDDPKLEISWPTVITTVSDKDRSWPLLD